MKPNYRLRFFLLQSSAALALLVNQATAATFTWDGSDTAFWNLAANWVGGVAPASANTTDIIISGTANVSTMLPGAVSYTVKSLTFDATNDADTRFTMTSTLNPGQSARNLTFSSASGNATLTVESGSTGNKTIDRIGTVNPATIILTSSLDVIHDGSGTLTLGNAVNASITGGGGINKSGTGTLSLVAANTYTGATTITGGTLSLDHATDTLSSSSAATVDGATAVLSIGGNSDTVGVVSLKNGGSITGTGGTLTGSSYAVESGSVSAKLGGAGIALTKSTAGTVTLSGTNTYTGLTTVSVGTLNLNTTAANSISGNLTVSGGSAVLQQSNQVDNARNVVVGGGTLDIAGNSDTVNGVQLTSGSITGSGRTLTSATAFDLEGGSASAILGGTLGANKTTGGTVTLTGANTYTGGTTISGGTLNVNADAALGGSAGAVAISNGATLQAAGPVSTGLRTLTLGTGGGVIDTNSNVVNFNIGSTVTGSTLTKTGLGTLNFDANSTLTGLGALAANNGTTNVNSVLGGGSSTVSVTGATTLKFGSVSQTLSSLTIGAGSTVTFTSGVAAFSGGGGGKVTSLGSTVPEPGTLGLLLVGALGVLNRRRRQA